MLVQGGASETGDGISGAWHSASIFHFCLAKHLCEGFTELRDARAGSIENIIIILVHAVGAKLFRYQRIISFRQFDVVVAVRCVSCL
jgi:hypothetical protein